MATLKQKHAVDVGKRMLDAWAEEHDLWDVDWRNQN